LISIERFFCMSLENRAYSAVIFPMASPMLYLVPRFHPPDCPRQFKPLFAVTRVVQVSRVIRIERPDDHLGLLDSLPTH
jgi:hypothetical protein